MPFSKHFILSIAGPVRNFYICTRGSYPTGLSLFSWSLMMFITYIV